MAEGPQMSEEGVTTTVSPENRSQPPLLPSPLGHVRSETVPVGRSFVDAVWDKFHDDMGIDTTLEIYVPKKGPAKITDSGHLILPRRLNMNDCDISTASNGQPADMTSMCFAVTELDLTRNPITSWEEVFQVIRCMPHLTFLNLAHNPLRSSPIPNDVVPTAANKAGVSYSVSPTNANIESHTVNTPQTSADGSETVATPVNDNVRCAGADLHQPVQNVPSANTPQSCPGLDEVSADDTNANVKPSAVDTALLELSSTRSESDTGKPAGTEECVQPVLGKLPDLRQLVLNDTRLDWGCIVDLLRLFPNLEELHLSLNCYTSVDLPSDFMHPSLLRLFFNGNEVYCWSQINKLGSVFPNLQQLYLAESNLSMLDETDTMASNFNCLESLSLTKTYLQGWHEFEKLRLLPSLTEVRLQGIPFLEEIQEKERRQMLIARLPNITRLNGSPVTAEEREDAERAFIRAFMDADDKPDRYYELEEVYGKLDPLVNVNLKPQTRFDVTFVMGEVRENLNISSNQTVRELKKMLESFAGLPAHKFNLLYVDKTINFGADRMSFPDKMLYTYQLSDGDEIIIQPKI